MIKFSQHPRVNTKITGLRLRHVRPLPVRTRLPNRRQVNPVRQISSREVPSQERVRTGLVHTSNFRVRQGRHHLTRSIRRIPVHSHQLTQQHSTRTRIQRLNTTSKHFSNNLILLRITLSRHVVNLSRLVLKRLPPRLLMHRL